VAELGEPVTADADGPGVGEPMTGTGQAAPRPMIERIGLGAIALVIAVLFGAVGAAALANGEVFLGIMAGIGALMTVWAAASGLRRG
jgi:hypothetical protein